jgi:DNA mismatch repair ATPase MutL
MVIDVLDENVIAQIRSSSVIDSVTQCVTELVRHFFPQS